MRAAIRDGVDDTLDASGKYLKKTKKKLKIFRTIPEKLANPSFL